MVAHACNPSYSKDRDWEYYNLRLAQRKSYQDPHLNQYLSMWHTLITSATQEA
jgi:hypothetical protein